MNNITNITMFKRYFAVDAKHRAERSEVSNPQFAMIMFFFVLLLTSCSLYAAQRHDKPNNTKRALTISHNKDFSGMNFKGKPLPTDLSYANLTGANLAGHHFSHTDFTGADLAGVILTDTACDYLQCFQNNVKANKLSLGEWYLDHLPKDLEAITHVYPCLLQDSQKATLLQIACGLAYLPYYENIDFYIKVRYWSCKLLLLKKQLGDMGRPLVCSLSINVSRDAEKYCFQTDYPIHLEHPKGVQIARHWAILATSSSLLKELSMLIQCYLTEPSQEFHANFDRYLQLFTAGLVRYNVMSERKWGYSYYRKTIEQNIKGLKKAYAKLTSPKLRKEAIEIAHQLSRQYKIQGLFFLTSFLSCQNRLIRFKFLVGVAVKNDIHYSINTITSPPLFTSWIINLK